MKALFKAATKPNSSDRCGRNKVNPSPIEANGSFPTPQYWMNNLSTAQPIRLPEYLYGVYSVNGRTESTDCGADENVDVKAASYISYVRERFKLDKAN